MSRERLPIEEHRRRGEILHRFDKYELDGDQRAVMDDMRGVFRSVASTILVETKPGREQAAALTALEEAKYWTNQAIAKDGVPA